MKEKLSQLFSDFFRSIGIDPYPVFFLILIALIAFKIKSYVDGKEKNKWDYMYDAVFFFVAFGLLVFFSFYLLGFIE
jgi:hypothetical protein